MVQGVGSGGSQSRENMTPDADSDLIIVKLVNRKGIAGPGSGYFCNNSITGRYWFCAH